MRKFAGFLIPFCLFFQLRFSFMVFWQRWNAEASQPLVIKKVPGGLSIKFEKIRFPRRPLYTKEKELSTYAGKFSWQLMPTGWVPPTYFTPVFQTGPLLLFLRSPPSIA